MTTDRSFLHLSLGAVAATTAVTLPHAAQGRIFPAARCPFCNELSGRGGHGRDCSRPVRLSRGCFPYSVPVMRMETGRII